jgi:hypothetical protein
VVFARMLGELSVLGYDITAPEKASEFLALVADCTQPEWIELIRKHVTEASEPIMSVTEKAQWPIPINEWWKEGMVECSEENWPETIAMLPWILETVCFTLSFRVELQSHLNFTASWISR